MCTEEPELMGPGGLTDEEWPSVSLIRKAGWENMPGWLAYSDLTAVGLKLLRWNGRRERTEKIVLRCLHTSLPPDNVKPASSSLFIIYSSHYRSLQQ